MRKYISTQIVIINILFFASLSINAQKKDSIHLYKIITTQYDEKREIKQNFFDSPSRMSDYANESFSHLGATYQSENKKKYREVLGSGNIGFIIQAQSYKKLNDRQSIWGEAGYQNIKVKNIRWNENLDYSNIAPYIIADSLGGDLNTEQYFFGGGYAKKYKKWTLGLSLQYTANMGYRQRDPRVNNTSSNLSSSIGVDYNISKKINMGGYFQVYKYTQNSSTDFVSEISQPKVYQMTGFGQYQYLLNGNNASFEEIRYKIGASITGTVSKDWYLSTHYTYGSNNKYIKTSSGTTLYDSSILHTTIVNTEFAKFFTIKNNVLGMLLNYEKYKKKGTEIGYDGNTSDIKKIYERLSYIHNVQNIQLKSFYQHKEGKYLYVIQPIISLQKNTEYRLYPASGQEYTAYTIGTKLVYKRKILQENILSIKADVLNQRFINKENKITPISNSSIYNWIVDDFNYLTSDNIKISLSARYDIKLAKFPALFCKIRWENQKIQNENNTFVSVSTGITF